MKYIIMGGLGQLGRALQGVLAKTPDAVVDVWDRPDYDLSSPDIAQQLAESAPDVVINVAAWTNVDSAETNPDAVYAVNALGPHYLAEGCGRCNALLVHISTNEVFPGLKGNFYREYDQPQAHSVYARSKLAGETAVLRTWSRAIIVRIAWLFGPGGVNFPTKIAAAADKLGALRVVDDEFGNPTYAPDAAAGIVRLAEYNRPGIFHVVNAGYTSRYELARAVLAASGRGHVPVEPIPGAEWKRSAAPPPHAVLINQAAAALGIQLRPWQEAVLEYGEQLRA